MGTLRKAFSETERGKRAACLAEALRNHPVLSAAQNCLVYWELWDELPLSPWFLGLSPEGPALFLPRVMGDQLEVCPLRPEVKPGAFGIMEPLQAPCSREALLELRDWVVLVPGVAFDALGNRLGRGRGYYDRFLRDYPNAYPIGVGYREQEVESLAVQAHDVPMKALILV